MKEPAGWRAYTADLARQYHVNVVFSPAPQESEDRSVLIRVRVSGKQDENTIEELNYDMDQYKKEHPGCQFTNLKIAHPEYKTFAKLFLIPSDFTNTLRA